MQGFSLVLVLSALCFGLVNCQISQNVTRQTTTYAYWGGFVRDNQGNFINSGGITSSTANFGGSQLVGPGIYLVKYDPNLNHLYSIQFGTTGTAYAAGTDSQNNIILAGSWSSTNLTFGGPILRPSGIMYTDTFFVKLTSTGSHVWSQKFNFSVANSLAVHTDDSIALCGYISANTTMGGSVLWANSGASDWFVAKFNSAGGHLWSFRLGGTSQDFATSIAVDNSGNYLVGGTYAGSEFTVNGVTLPSPSSNDIVILKLDINGTILWYKNFGSSGADQLNSIAFDSSNNVVLTGYAGGSIDLIQPHNGANDIFVIKYSSSGVFQWSKLMGSFGNDIGNDIQCGLNDTIYVTGTYTYNASVGGATLPNTTSGMFVAKYASDGAHIWSRGYNSTSNSATGKRIALDAPWNRIAYAFEFSGSISFGGPTMVSAAGPTVGYVLLTEAPTIVPASPSPSPAAASPSSTPSPLASSSTSPSQTPSVSSSPSASPSISACLPCITDADCSNQGICSNVTSPRYCSCFSGFGGCNCEIRPAVACEPLYQQVTDLSAYFKPNASLDYQGYNIYINVDAPLQETAIVNPASSNTPNSSPYSLETLIYFGSGPHSYPNCTFPLRPTWSDLAASGPRCVDSYSTNLTWAFARTYCGFIAANNTKNYTSEMTISRRYLTSNGQQRIEQTARTLNVVFPSEVTVQESYVTITFPSAGLSATITFVDYNPSDDRWTVKVATEVDLNYYVSNSSSVVSVTSTISSLNRVPSLQVSPCTNSGLICGQILTYTFPQGTAPDACLGLVGSVVTNVDIQCAAGSCAPTNTSQLTIQLDTADSCPITDTIDFSVASFYSFQDAALTVQTTIFDNNDIAFFGADVQSSEATIQSRSVKPGSVCFQNGAGPCVAVQYTELTSVNGKDPVFSVNFASPANQAVFGGILNPTAFTVKATIQVSFAGAKGWHLKNIPSSQTVDLSLSTFMQPDQSESAKILPSLILTAFLLLTFGFQ